MKALQTAALAMLVGCAGAPAYAQGLFVRRAEVPQCPAIALQTGLVATIQVTVTVKKGAVTDATVLTGTASARFFQRLALANIRTWEFEGGVDTTFITTFIYELTDTLTEVPENPRVELKLPFHVRVVGSRTKPDVISVPAPIRPPNRESMPPCS